MLITSRGNANIKRIRSLRRRKAREHTGLFFVEGRHLLREALETHAGIEHLVICPELLTDKLNWGNLSRLEVTAEVFQSISESENPEGIGAVVRQRWKSLEDISPSKGLCWIAINSVQCPSNLGTLLRISDAVGGSGVILIGNSTDPYHPAAVRSSLGTTFSQRLVRTTFQAFAEWKRRRQLTLVGTSPSASEDYRSVEYQSPLILFMGNEWFGLTVEQQRLCDTLVRIPMVGRVNSHNVAVAAGVVLYEVFSQSNAK